MKTRIIFGVTGLFALLTAIFLLPSIVFDIVIVVLGAIAAVELASATKLVKDPILCKLTAGCAVFYGLSQSLAVRGMFDDLTLADAVVMLTIVLIFFVRLLQKHESTSFIEVAVATFSAIIIPYLMLSLVRIFHMEHGSLLVLLPMVAAWGSDTCAYFAGVTLGKHKLAPVISPKKTIEGAVGGIIGAAGIMLLCVTAYNAHSSLDISTVGAIALGAVGAVIGQLGDLTFSVIKRQCQVKDYGHIFPGHGGVLDRFDSIVVVAPVIEILLLILA